MRSSSILTITRDHLPPAGGLAFSLSTITVLSRKPGVNTRVGAVDRFFFVGLTAGTLLPIELRSALISAGRAALPLCQARCMRMASDTLGRRVARHMRSRSQKHQIGWCLKERYLFGSTAGAQRGERAKTRK